MEIKHLKKQLKKLWDDERDLFSREVSKKEKDLFSIEQDKAKIKSTLFYV